MAVSDASFPRLLADVGGTHVRFGWLAAPGAAIDHVLGLACADHASIEAALQHYLDVGGVGAVRPRWAAMGIATALDGDWVAMTNHPWAFSVAALRQRFGLEQLLVLNDFTALALALPALHPTELRQVGAGSARDGAPRALLGPGTGLGVSGLLRESTSGRWLALDGEGGHVTLAPANEREAAVLAQLRQRFGHASAERALSGPGLVHLYEALCAVDGLSRPALTPAEVGAGAGGGDPCCAEAVALFFSFLGNVAGNLALSLGARGGVYIGGGIVPKLGAAIDHSCFREQFEAKGRFADYLRAIPTFVIEARLPPALLGAARALEDLAGASATG